MVRRVWGEPKEAEEAGAWMSRTSTQLENISSSDRIIWLKPGETILGHTNEFIGGRRTITTMMKARSSMGRNFIEVCKCAGWGDVGYVNRWTMEITNNSLHYSIPLVVGRRIAQIVFFDSDGTLQGRSYENAGKYQSANEMNDLIASWKPTAMLPQMYLDREIAAGPSKEIHCPLTTLSENKYPRAEKETTTT
jgi:deoxycytidine triphosphate deaminase